MFLSKRERQLCNHCRYSEWEYGTSVISGWYICTKKRDTKFDDDKYGGGKCGDFEHYEGILIRKKWLK